MYKRLLEIVFGVSLFLALARVEVKAPPGNRTTRIRARTGQDPFFAHPSAICMHLFINTSKVFSKLVRTLIYQTFIGAGFSTSSLNTLIGHLLRSAGRPYRLTIYLGTY